MIAARQSILFKYRPRPSSRQCSWSSHCHGFIHFPSHVSLVSFVSLNPCVFVCVDHGLVSVLSLVCLNFLVGSVCFLCSVCISSYVRVRILFSGPYSLFRPPPLAAVSSWSLHSLSSGQYPPILIAPFASMLWVQSLLNPQSFISPVGDPDLSHPCSLNV